MFRAPSDHPQALHIKRAYIKHKWIIKEITILVLKNCESHKFRRGCLCRIVLYNADIRAL